MYPGGRGSVTFNMVVLSMYVGREALYMIFIIIVNIGFFHCFLFGEGQGGVITHDYYFYRG